MQMNNYVNILLNRYTRWGKVIPYYWNHNKTLRKMIEEFVTRE